MQGQFLTDRGRIRVQNEDAGGTFYNKENQLLAVIADGMGGHQAGEVASKMATNVLKEKWEAIEKIEAAEQAEKWLSQTVREINHTIYQSATETKEYDGMGTTIVIAICTYEFITIAHIGDSRCYLFSNDGFKQITEDHSLVNELIRAGQLSEDEAHLYPRQNVLVKALGTEEDVHADIQTIGWEIGNKILLCSDGLTNKLSADEISNFIHANKTIKEIGHDMIHLANERGGEDNISLVIIVHDPVTKAGESPC